MSGNIGRGLAEVREALSRGEASTPPIEEEGEPGAEDENELRPTVTAVLRREVTHAVRRNRGVIVLTTFLGAFWLCIAGVVSAATREGPFAETVLSAEHEPPFVAAAALPGPIEWPTIAIAPRAVKAVKAKKKH